MTGLISPSGLVPRAQTDMVSAYLPSEVVKMPPKRNPKSDRKAIHRTQLYGGEPDLSDAFLSISVQLDRVECGKEGKAIARAYAAYNFRITRSNDETVPEKSSLSNSAKNRSHG